MPDAEIIKAVLIEGAIGGAVLSVLAFLLSRFVKEIVGRSLLVIVLFVAAGAYFGFATVGVPGSIWLLVELAHMILFGTMALLVRRNDIALISCESSSINFLEDRLQVCRPIVRPKGRRRTNVYLRPRLRHAAEDASPTLDVIDQILDLSRRR